MKSTSLKMKILSGMLSAGIAFSGTSLAFATDNNIENEKVVTNIKFKHSSSNKKVDTAQRAEMKATLQIVIKESVNSNIITKAEGDKVLEYVSVKSEKKHKECEKGKCDGKKGGLFNDLVTEGILTKDKSEALREKMYVKRTEIKTVELKNGLKGLVDDKVITIEQSNKVQDIMMERQTQRKEIYKKMQNMSQKERQEYVKKMDSTKASPMKVLIDNGTITKEQEAKIQQVLPHHGHHHK
ncbi:hypothetical protein [Clostridium estertheticum]|uniref:DUF2680 domain-containing protein n=1 Tax=Clostridium estertheticum TaxID=238834 RepID=A0AA47I6P8_9CLOT|nr:hypothetical protein [Clostridium estertheticum]MBU3155521.1 hypothetical protein [Clostridium estertheticum]WAG60080.1 hypothetical protein LL038_21480 [Clostridium estertheticum]